LKINSKPYLAEKRGDKVMKRFETKLERELQEIKTLLLELLERDELSKSESEIRGIMKLFEISMKDFFEDEVLYSISDVKNLQKIFKL
jgi:hypothetical protein